MTDRTTRRREIFNLLAQLHSAAVAEPGAEIKMPYKKEVHAAAAELMELSDDIKDTLSKNPNLLAQLFPDLVTTVH